MSFTCRVTHTCPWGTSSANIVLKEKPHLGELAAATAEVFQIECNKKAGEWGITTVKIKKFYIETGGRWNEVVSSSQLTRHCHLYGSSRDGDHPTGVNEIVQNQFSPSAASHYSQRLGSASPMSPQSIQMDEQLNDNYKLSLSIDDHRTATRDETSRYLTKGDISPARVQRQYRNEY